MLSHYEPRKNLTTVENLDAEDSSNTHLKEHRQLSEKTLPTPSQLKASKKLPLTHIDKPNYVKTAIEEMAGLSLDGVKIHYNSNRPAQIGAQAYAHGDQVHMAPGQEKNLAHELWHVVQQARGQVTPTHIVDGDYINADVSLENEAHMMAQKTYHQPIRHKAIAKQRVPLHPVHSIIKQCANLKNKNKKAIQVADKNIVFKIHQGMKERCINDDITQWPTRIGDVQATGTPAATQQEHNGRRACDMSDYWALIQEFRQHPQAKVFLRERGSKIGPNPPQVLASTLYMNTSDPQSTRGLDPLATLGDHYLEPSGVDPGAYESMAQQMEKIQKETGCEKYELGERYIALIKNPDTIADDKWTPEITRVMRFHLAVWLTCEGMRDIAMPMIIPMMIENWSKGKGYNPIVEMRKTEKLTKKGLQKKEKKQPLTDEDYVHVFGSQLTDEHPAAVNSSKALLNDAQDATTSQSLPNNGAVKRMIEIVKTYFEREEHSDFSRPELSKFDTTDEGFTSEEDALNAVWNQLAATWFNDVPAFVDWTNPHPESPKLTANISRMVGRRLKNAQIALEIEERNLSKPIDTERRKAALERVLAQQKYIDVAKTFFPKHQEITLDCEKKIHLITSGEVRKRTSEELGGTDFSGPTGKNGAQCAEEVRTKEEADSWEKNLHSYSPNFRLSFATKRLSLVQQGHAQGKLGFPLQDGVSYYMISSYKDAQQERQRIIDLATDLAKSKVLEKPTLNPYTEAYVDPAWLIDNKITEQWQQECFSFHYLLSLSSLRK